MVELGTTEQVIGSAGHTYAQALLSRVFERCFVDAPRALLPASDAAEHGASCWLLDPAGRPAAP